MRATGLVRIQTIKNVIKAFEKLGYIKLLPSGFFELTYFKDIPKEPTKESVNIYDELMS